MTNRIMRPDCLFILSREDFTNIILVFDYERHDTHFSEEKINGMQRCFTDATNMGKLYINYPMIESYQHLCNLPDKAYGERSVPVWLQPGKEYQAMVEKETMFGSLVDFPHRIDESIYKALEGVINDGYLQTARYQLMDWIKKQNYVNGNQTYWKYMRYIFQQIIEHNICKANKMQYHQYEISEEKYKECFERIDLAEILRIQNLSSRDEKEGVIWVLNTCVFFVAEYSFELLMDRL